jgi:hypothetical protein
MAIAAAAIALVELRNRMIILPRRQVAWSDILLNHVGAELAQHQKVYTARAAHSLRFSPD